MNTHDCDVNANDARTAERTVVQQPLHESPGEKELQLHLLPPYCPDSQKRQHILFMSELEISTISKILQTRETVRIVEVY